MNDVAVIVRSMGEATESILVSILRQWYGEKNVFVLKNVSPFSETVRQMILLATKLKQKWLLAVDADIFFSKDRLDDLLVEGERIVGDNFMNGECRLLCLMPDLYDNFMQRTRGGGHLYYTRNLQKGLSYINAESLRAETYLIRSMAADGYASYSVRITVGIHDFFQDYKDIVAKGILHSRKHGDIDELMNIWQASARENPDYYWMLKGAELGKKHKTDSSFRNDRTYIYGIIEDAKLNIPKREPFTEAEIENKLAEYINVPYMEKVRSYEDNGFSWRIIWNEFLKLDFFKKLKEIKDKIYAS